VYWWNPDYTIQTCSDYIIWNAPRVILEKNRAREERHRVGKVILNII